MLRETRAWAVMSGLLACGAPEPLAESSARSAAATPVLAVDAPGHTARLPGVVVSTHAVEVRSPARARIARLDVSVGDVVAKGDPLAVLDSEDVDADAGVAHAEHRALQAELASVRRTHGSARRRLADAERLLADSLVTRQERDDLQLAVEQAAGDIERLRAEIDGNVVRRERLRDVGRDRVLRAPEAGVVAACPVHPGALVEASATVVRLVDGQARRVRFAVEPVARAQWWTGRRVEVAVEGLDETSGATVLTVAPEVDAPSQRIFVDAWVDDSSMPMPEGLAVWVTPAGAAPEERGG